MARLTATEVARRFSEILNRVAAGEQIEVTRSGAAIAVIAPMRQRGLPPARFSELMAAAPPVDEAFAGDVRALRGSIGPPEGSWRS